MDMLAAFEKWFNKHNNTLAIPMVVVARAPASIRLRFVGIVRTIEVLVLREEIVVMVEHDGICWDILTSFESAAVAAPDGTARVHCDLVGPVAYATHQAMFSDHPFEQLADWIVTSLMPARALGLGGSSKSGMTWAVLLSADDKGYRVIVPLRILPVHGCRSH